MLNDFYIKINRKGTEMKHIQVLLLFGALFGLSGMTGCSTMGGGQKQEKTVYHINDSAVAKAAMNNVKNHLSANPDAKIVIVTHGKGVDFLFDGAADKDGNPYNVNVEELEAKGVQIDVCANTLKSRKLDKNKLLPGLVIVPSGVAEIAKLQATEGYVYLKP